MSIECKFTFLRKKPSIHRRLRVRKAGTQVLSLPAPARVIDRRFPGA
jgi:hypothetical protein